MLILRIAVVNKTTQNMCYRKTESDVNALVCLFSLVSNKKKGSSVLLY